MKQLTILHSNDIHRDFLTKEVDGKKKAGLSLLSGYIKEFRKTHENVIYAISGDMFRGSVIDSEYKGLSTKPSHFHSVLVVVLYAIFPLFPSIFSNCVVLNDPI